MDIVYSGIEEAVTTANIAVLFMKSHHCADFRTAASENPPASFSMRTSPHPLFWGRGEEDKTNISQIQKENKKGEGVK